MVPELVTKLAQDEGHVIKYTTNEGQLAEKVLDGDLVAIKSSGGPCIILEDNTAPTFTESH